MLLLLILLPLFFFFFLLVFLLVFLLCLVALTYVWSGIGNHVGVSFSKLQGRSAARHTGMWEPASFTTPLEVVEGMKTTVQCVYGV